MDGCVVTWLQEPTRASCCNNRINKQQVAKINSYKTFCFTPLNSPDLPAGWWLTQDTHTVTRWTGTSISRSWRTDTGSPDREQGSSRDLGQWGDPHCSPGNLPLRKHWECEKGFINWGGGAGGRTEPSWLPPITTSGRLQPHGERGHLWGPTPVLWGHALFAGFMESTHRGAAFVRERQIFWSSNEFPVPPRVISHNTLKYQMRQREQPLLSNLFLPRGLSLFLHCKVFSALII